MARISAVACLVLCTLAAGAFAEGNRKMLISEVGDGAFDHVSVPCNTDVLGNPRACYQDAGIGAVGNVDFPFGDPAISYPKDGSPWGVHLTGPYPDGETYLVSWHSGEPQVGPAASLPEPGSAANKTKAYVRLSTKPMKANGNGNGNSNGNGHGADKGNKGDRTLQGRVIDYKRAYTSAKYANVSYYSPALSHVILKGLKPSTTYFYTVGDGSKWSDEYSFTTLASIHSRRSAKYPLRVGLIADVGQTYNSSATRDHLLLSAPDVVILVADNSYADNYGPLDFEKQGGGGTNQRKWDSYQVLWEPVFSSAPVLNAAGNHEIEQGDIAAVINYTTTSFSYPSNYPFQSYTNRWPVPGTTYEQLGNITNNLYYATTVGGVIRLITMNNYVPFHPGTPQYEWAMAEFKAVDRSVTPWLIVQFHAPPYHTYNVHYKEMDCFMSVYEDTFYEYGVDFIANGHVHAYERTHPVYKYKEDTCAPIYITIGDGGNVEGPYRNFIDEFNPLSNRTYCEAVTTSGLSPNTLQVSNPSGWGPGYQRQAHAPGCPTLSWQPAYGVKGGPVGNVLNTTANSSTPLGFCQTSQPLWSAHRDPSFGHAVLTLMSEDVAELTWYRNIDNKMVAADRAVLERQAACSVGERRRRLSAHAATA